MTYQIDNLRRTNDGIRVDRLSPLGNPFKMRNENEREQVIEAYRRYLYRVVFLWDETTEAANILARSMNLQISSTWLPYNRSQFCMALNQIEEAERKNGTVTLLCWCYPSKCHCNELINYLEYCKNANK